VPVPASLAAGGVWKFRIDKAGKYLLIDRQDNDRWNVVDSKILEAGEQSLVRPNARELEILPDRRP
jgi:hypothetical protein